MSLNPRWLPWAALAALAFSLPASAQNTGGGAAGGADTSGKKELSQRVVQLQQPGIENLARQLVEMPAQQMLGDAQMVIQQRVAADKRQAVWQQVESDARRYLEDATPLVRDRALKVAPEVLTPILEKGLTEDELRQVVQVLQSMESPAYRKYSNLMPDMLRALNERVVNDTKAAVEPKVRAMQNAASKRFPQAPATGAPAGAGAPAKKP